MVVNHIEKGNWRIQILFAKRDHEKIFAGRNKQASAWLDAHKYNMILKLQMIPNHSDHDKTMTKWHSPWYLSVLCKYLNMLSNGRARRNSKQVDDISSRISNEGGNEQSSCVRHYERFVNTRGPMFCCCGWPFQVSTAVAVRVSYLDLAPFCH